MRNYIYKTIITIIAFIIVFEFTIGKTLNKITSQTDLLLTREGRKEMVNSIKNEMNKAIKSSRKEFSKHTPKMETIKVDKKDIATVIGKGGATIREIVETSGAKVDVKDTGEVTVAAPDEASRNKAIEIIKNFKNQQLISSLKHQTLSKKIKGNILYPTQN